MTRTQRVIVPLSWCCLLYVQKCGEGLQCDGAGLGAAHAAERAREAGSAAKAILSEAEQRLSEAEPSSTVALAALVSSAPGKAVATPAAAAAEGSHGCDVRPVLS